MEETTTQEKKGFIGKFLDFIEKAGNKLPDPAVLFLILMLLVWALSAILSNFSFAEIDPRTG
ncbi:MAG TPA: AbgT family transporter, partial [Flavobacteriaceae bacterium]|nr:AbgT family transporter [Flavobacteriaceae bacterium]